MLNKAQMEWCLRKENELREKYPIQSLVAGLDGVDDRWAGLVEDVNAIVKLVEGKQAYDDVKEWFIFFLRELDKKAKLIAPVNNNSEKKGE